MEENKENNLQPPVPQFYAATVARQSTVPSTSTMPGKHHICHSSGRSHKTTWGKVESVPDSKGSSRITSCALHTGAAGLWSSPGSSPATETGQEFSALLPGPLCQLCSLCRAVPQTGPGQSRNHCLSDSSCCQVVSRSCYRGCRSQGSPFLR